MQVRAPGVKNALRGTAMVGLADSTTDTPASISRLARIGRLGRRAVFIWNFQAQTGFGDRNAHRSIFPLTVLRSSFTRRAVSS